MISAMVRYPCRLACGEDVVSAFASTLGLVSFTICSQKSTPTRFSWKMLWSNMYSAASPRLMIHSPRCGGRPPEAFVLVWAEQGGRFSPPAPPIRLALECGGRGAFHFLAISESRRSEAGLCAV